ncbi:MAG: peptidase domain-containing ABC transporter [Halofilum sp. (in: g-proteobacteria)]|nr:peptidase domain-containing ABC transporter [Halofilum sp. (in: g-proteobacteria)]
MLRLPTPFMAETTGHGCLVVAAIDEEAVTAFDPAGATETRMAPHEFTARASGRVVLVRPADAPSRTADGRRFGLHSLLPRLLLYRGTVAQLLLASLVIQMFAMATPLFTMVIIDKVLTTGALSTLNVLVIGLAAIALFDLAIGALRSLVFANVTHRLDVELVADLFRHLTRLPMSFFGSRKTGDTVTRVRELETVRQFLTGPSLTALVDFVFAFLFIGVMALFSVHLTIIVIASMTLMLAMYGLLAPAMKRRLERKYGSTSDNQSFLVEAVSGIETMKSLSLEPQMQARWERQAVDQTQVTRESERLTTMLSQVAQFLNKGTVALTLWLGALMVIDGNLTAGQLIAFNMMVGRVMAPALRLAQLFQQLSQTRVSVGRLGEIFDATPEPGSSRHPDSLPPLSGRVRLEQVSFRYHPESPDALRDVSFDVEPGEVVGIVGSSGAGKTSLLRLLQRLYVPQRGRILVDGVNVSDIDPAWLRRRVGAVTQDTVLFNGTVRENIAAASPNLPIEAVEHAARLAAADEFIRALPKAYDTVVGERGCQLSSGQRQRVALARALACEPRMLLMDEPTSSLDAYAERRIQENLREIVAGRTVFIVSHRLSMLRVCDRILVLDEGRLVEQGCPQELLAREGAFAQLEQAQRPFSATGEVAAHESTVS